ncbi:hypothetical protein HAX54_037367, partial [Datura stramonium]|nr:hypothetical protein [Datura stramonium]
MLDSREAKLRDQSDISLAEIRCMMTTRLEDMNIAVTDLRRKNIFHTRCRIKGTYGKVCIEEPSLDTLNPKVVETTCPTDQVHVDEKDKDKDKENYFGSFQ